MIDVDPKYMAMVKCILAEHAQGLEVRAFGSRVNGRARKDSDLDIAVVGEGRVDWRFVERLKDAFSVSDLPFIVDVVDWHSIDENFRNIIEKKYEVVDF